MCQKGLEEGEEKKKMVGPEEGAEMKHVSCVCGRAGEEDWGEVPENEISVEEEEDPGSWGRGAYGGFNYTVNQSLVQVTRNVSVRAQMGLQLLVDWHGGQRLIKMLVILQILTLIALMLVLVK